MELRNKHCIPCEEGIEILAIDVALRLKTSIHPDWKVENNHHLMRDFRFVNFRQTMDFVNQVARVAEDEGHHPDLHISYGQCIIRIWTHSIDGLSENDFILASNIDML